MQLTIDFFHDAKPAEGPEEQLQKVIVNGLKILLNAKPKNFIRTEKFGLNVDDKVVKIGRKTINGKYSSSCRIFEMEPYMIYQGLFIDGTDTFMSFKLPPQQLHDPVNNTTHSNASILFSFIDDVPGSEPELILSDHDKLSISIYKAIFKTTN